jgi:hypothetical protein
MRSFPFVPVALACAISSTAVAQNASESNLVLTILGGVITGHELWRIDKQPFCVGDVCSGQYDTLQLSRSINSSLMLGASGTFFISPHLGLHVELSYVGLPTDSGCTGLFFHPDSEQKNEQICDDIQSQAGKGGAIAVLGGVTLRAAARRVVSPYVRGNIGLVSQSHSTIEVVGAYFDASGVFRERQVVLDQNPRKTSLTFGAAAGFTTPLGTGYQLRFQASDVVSAIDRLTGPTNALAIGPTAKRYYHHLTLTIGLDVVLEKKRGRRY